MRTLDLQEEGRMTDAPVNADLQRFPTPRVDALLYERMKDMSDRSKLYLVSILGISKRAEDPTQPDNQVGRFTHIPMLIVEQSIDNAEEEACVQANRMFSKELGFITKHITVQPMPPEAYLHILQLSHQGLLADSDEPVEQPVYFECSLEEPDPDDEVILELGKLEN